MSIRNNASLIGNLGANPVTTTLESGLVITEFNLATNEYFRDRDGQRQTRTMWHSVKAFGKQAEILGQYLSSGSMVAIEGRISYRKWTDKHEQVRVSTEIIAEDFTFLSPKDASSPPTYQQSRRQEETVAQTATETMVVNDDGPKEGTNTKKAGGRKRQPGKATKAARKPTPVNRGKTKGASPVVATLEDDELPF